MRTGQLRNDGRLADWKKPFDALCGIVGRSTL
jgi:hypothetical protein